MEAADPTRVARLPFLSAGLVIFVLGTLVGAPTGGRLSAGRLLIGYASAAAARLAVHFSNDYLDGETDEPGSGRLISGGGVAPSPVGWQSWASPA